MIPTLPTFLLLLASALLAGGGVYAPGFLRIGALAFAGVLVVMVGDFFLSRRLYRLTVTRQVEDKLSLARANPVRIEVANRCGLPLALVVKDDAPWEFEASRREIPLHLAPFERVQVDYTLTPRRRGNFDFANLHVRALSLLRLSQWQRHFPAAVRVKVYPDLLGIERYVALARARRLEEMGFRPLRYLGEGAEFDFLREYSPDDDYRKIDWKATARHGRPVTRQYDLERSQTLMLVIDAGRMMCATVGGTTGVSPVAAMSKLDYAINAALMLAYVAVEADDAVGLTVFAEELETFVAPGKGLRQVGLLADQLYAVQPVLREPNYGEAFALLRRRTQRRALVVTFTDLIDREASAQLLANVRALAPRHLPLVVTLRDHRLDALAQARPAEAREAYQRAVVTDLLAQRRLALASLRAGGALVLDAAPADLTVATVNRYLEIKQRAVL
jgi:uncharacterized protein (DUF58 family)